MRFCILLVFGAFSLQAFGNPIETRTDMSPAAIPWWSVNAGGNIYSGSGSYQLSSSAGQSIVGRIAGTNYAMHVGFWNPGVIYVGIQEALIEDVPRVHGLSQNYPNPFRRSTAIRYAIPKSEAVKIEVYNIAGQCVRVLVDEFASPGYKVVSWDGRDESGVGLGCGVYFYRITSLEFEATRKMLLLR